MDAMLMSFPSSTAAQHNNFIAYSGPPASKNSKRAPARGTPHTREEGLLVRLSSHEDVDGHRSSVGAKACDTPIVVRGGFESPTNVASASADGFHEVEDRATAGIDGGDLSAGFLGSPCDLSEWSSLYVNLRFQEGQTSIECTSANATASVGALDSTEAQVVAPGEVRGDTPVGDRDQEFTAATDLLAMDTCPDRGTCAEFSAAHAAAESPLCPSLDVVAPSARNRGERQTFCSVDDDAMQIVERKEETGPDSPQDAPEVDDAFRHPVQSESSARKGQDDLLPDSPVLLGDEPSGRGHSPTRSPCALGNHTEVDSSDDEIRPWKPRRRRRSISCIPRGISETGSPQQQSRLSCASNVTSLHQRAVAPQDLQSGLRPGCPADVEEHACPAELQESVGPSTPPGVDESLGLGSSPDDQPQTGRERPGRRDVTRDKCVRMDLPFFLPSAANETSLPAKRASILDPNRNLSVATAARKSYHACAAPTAWPAHIALRVPSLGHYAHVPESKFVKARDWMLIPA
ncbi:hypothetical protein CKM354_001128300 [Cercospora kikuchii]|uniref:Uncharacterized protein n=1 Tax=Cercospora kikuchii TaxID=84275 RepID=A0A9P3CSP4_9PEZI|nr:uncharacterized protein CKM354_001128300 [Cercospora kikuchii]GIZ48214.1 hypothetical protein CKM354_001128300 [Cercospora kikuchii]